MKDELSILTYGAAKSAGGGGGTGDGDMKKSVYDTNNDGVVDAADNAATVSGHTVAKDVPSDAKFTDTVYDDTSISNRVGAIEEVIPEGATSSNQLATESDIPTIVANPSGSASAGDLTKLQIGSDIYGVPSGGGNTTSKIRYEVASTAWSSSANADGYYTATVTLNPSIGSSPDVYIAGSADGTQPTSTQESMFAYVKRCKVNGSTLTLYATSKPSSTFYIWVDGVNGESSTDVVGSIIKPNEVSGGGGIPHITDMTPITMYQTNRFTVVEGGYKTVGNKCYINVLFKLMFDLTSSETFPFKMHDAWMMYTNALPMPRNKYAIIMSASWMKYANNTYTECSFGNAWVRDFPANNRAEMMCTSMSNLNGTSNDYYVLVTGEYDI